MTQPILPVKQILLDSVRLYFAPITGAYRGIKAEFKRLEHEIEQRRRTERDNARRTPARAS